MNADNTMHELRNRSDLPQLHQGDLDRAALEALEQDLSQLTKIESVIPRQKNAVRGETPVSIDLSAAFEGLRDGSYLGVQVRYSYDGEAWCDTLMAKPDGVRLVRMNDRALDSDS